MEKLRKHNGKLYISGIFLVALLALTFLYLFSEFDAAAIFKNISQANFSFLSLGFFMVILYLLCYGLFARTLLNSLGTKTSLFKGFLYAGIDFYYSAITPSASGGQPLVIYYMAKDGIPTSQASFSTLLHTAVFKAVLLFINIFAMIFCFDSVVESGPLFVVLLFIGLAFNVFIISICLLSMFKKSATKKAGLWTIKFLSKIKIMKKADERCAAFEKVLDEYQDAAKFIKTHKLLFLRLFLIVLVQRTAFFSIAYIAYRSMGLSGYGYFYFLSIQALISLAVDSLPLPGGIGVNEAAIILTLQSTFGSAERAASGMLLIRSINYYFCLIICSIASISVQLYHSFKRKKQNGNVIKNA
ncbi:MAG: lysylphosphatidylglycerol synthase transmembrane domain-containing protein [Clostridia bacterium]